mgnify:CR=1 FL=1
MSRQSSALFILFGLKEKLPKFKNKLPKFKLHLSIRAHVVAQFYQNEIKFEDIGIHDNKNLLNLPMLLLFLLRTEKITATIPSMGHSSMRLKIDHTR